MENMNLMEKTIVPTTANILKEHQGFSGHAILAFPKRLLLKTFTELSVRISHFRQKQSLTHPSFRKRVKEQGQPKAKRKSSLDTIPISNEIIQHILVSLKQFEREKGYLDCDVDLTGLAKSFGTNHSYLSRVINQVKGVSFKNYLNHLRIEHAYVDLQTDLKKRRFTVEAIAHENGFRSAESFSKKFKQRYGMYPSVFLRKLNEPGNS